MIRLGKNTSCSLPLVLYIGVLVLCHITMYSLVTSKAAENLPELLHRILSLELKEVQCTEWDEKNRILYLTHKNKTGRIHLYEPIKYDLDKDGRDDIVVVGGQFDKWGAWEFEDEDFLAVYTLGENVPPKSMFSKRFQQTDKGEFTDIKVEDITGDGFPESWIKYNFATAGARRWSWKEFLYVIQGKGAFNTLLEVQTREGKGGVKGDEYLMETEVHIEDLNEDGINEIMITRYEGKDEDTLRKTPPQPLLYHFIDGRYQLAHD